MREAFTQHLRVFMGMGDNERQVIAGILVCAVNVKSLLDKAIGTLPLLPAFFVGVPSIGNYNATIF
jgi:hypothetical protein